MKFPLLPTTAVAILFVIPASVRAQQSLVTTTGSAEIKVAPDLADLRFEVEVRGQDLDAARKDQAARATKVLAALRAAGIEEKELSTSQARISSSYADRNSETVAIKFFRVVQDFSCTLHDVRKIGDITSAVVTAGATGVSEVVLRTSELRKHRDEARRQAVTAAKEKAQALAAELGAKIGPPHSVTENDDRDPFRYGYNGATSNFITVGDTVGGGGSAFAPGVIPISASVTVAFDLE